MNRCLEGMLEGSVLVAILIVLRVKRVPADVLGGFRWPRIDLNRVETLPKEVAIARISILGGAMISKGYSR